MARNQRKYNTEYKVQAVKLSNEIGSSKAAVELGIPVDMLSDTAWRTKRTCRNKLQQAEFLLK